MMNKFEIRTEKKKSDILKASLKLFSENGYNNVSIKEIATKAKVSQVSIYNHFENKEKLVVECIMFSMKKIIKKAEDILEENVNFKNKIVKVFALCNIKANYYINDIISENAWKDEKFVELALKGLNSQKNEIYRKYIEYGRSINAINENVSVETILELLGAINLMYSKIEIVDYETKSRELLNILFEGILA